MSNIYQVINEKDIDEILFDHKPVVTVLMIASKNCKPCSNVKPLFIKLSKENSKFFFVYVDLTNFTPTEGKYTKHVKGTPYFSFYYNLTECGNVYGSNQNELLRVFNQILTAWEQKVRENPEIKSQVDELLNKDSNSQDNKECDGDVCSISKEEIKKERNKEIVETVNKDLEQMNLLEKERLLKEQQQEELLKNQKLQQIQQLENAFKMTRGDIVGTIRKLQMLKDRKKEDELRQNKRTTK